MIKSKKFDSNQKKTGVNKYGHCQFGKYSCQYCKSDSLTLIDFINGERVKDNTKAFECVNCKHPMIIK